MAAGGTGPTSSVSGALGSSNKPVRNPANPVVFFDVQIGGHAIGRIKFELFKDVAPKTVENFRQFCTGEMKVNNAPVGYKGSAFHRVIRDFMVQGGDFVKGDGTGSLSIYGSSFADETFALNHDRAGLLSMANNGPNANGCQFFITCGECHWLDNKHVVFGQVLDSDSMLVVRKIESVTVDGTSSCPKLPVTISECGEL